MPLICEPQGNGRFCIFLHNHFQSFTDPSCVKRFYLLMYSLPPVIFSPSFFPLLLLYLLLMKTSSRANFHHNLAPYIPKKPFNPSSLSPSSIKPFTNSNSPLRLRQWFSNSIHPPGNQRSRRGPGKSGVGCELYNLSGTTANSKISTHLAKGAANKGAFE